MKFIAHRINTVSELKKIPKEFGIEIDLRDNKNDLILSHDPFFDGEFFEKFLENYEHSFIILNVKSEGIEYKILEILDKFKIENYFFLDSSFPMIYNLSSTGLKNIALRFSEFESLESVLMMKGKVNWVWVDFFTKTPLTKSIFLKLKESDFKICLVSPELQKQPEKIDIYIDMLIKKDIKPDLICSKIYNHNKWQKIFN